MWTQGGFTASGFLDYVDGVKSDVTDMFEKTASFMTLDTTFRYDTSDRGGAWSGIDVALTVNNVLNREPPRHTPMSDWFVSYDSTNYSAIGRFVSFTISKRL